MGLQFESLRGGGGGSGTPALPFNSIQFNSAGAFAGSADLVWDGASLNVGNVPNKVGVYGDGIAFASFAGEGNDAQIAFLGIGGTVASPVAMSDGDHVGDLLWRAFNGATFDEVGKIAAFPFAAIPGGSLGLQPDGGLTAVGGFFKLAPFTFATLPAYGAAGMLAHISDSNTVIPGATIAGGGANQVEAFHDGTNWIVSAATRSATQTYTESNVTTDRTYNANSTSLDELADVLGTLLGDLRAKGIVA